MAAITTRAGKGSPLTNAELDSNFTNINDGITTAAAITGGTINGTSIGATTPSTGVFSEIDVDNLELNGNAIISTDTNGNIDLTPNGTGTVNVTKLTNSSLTSGRVTYATTAGLLTDSANLLYSGTDLTVYGLTVGRGAGAVATNTAVGASALAAITTGARNTAIGYNSLLTNSTGGLNTAVGEGSLKNNTAGNNTAVGVNSLLSNTSGSENTAIGRSSASVNTTGASLVAVGYGSLDSNTTGSNNVAVGLSALAANTTASNNTAVGYQAGYANTTGTYLTAVGNQAAYSNTTGNANSAFGLSALRQGLITQQVQATPHWVCKPLTPTPLPQTIQPWGIKHFRVIQLEPLIRLLDIGH
jgi:trimeric autotransporter adhesin